MEKQVKTGNKIVLWKKSNNTWNVESYIAAHPEYQNMENDQNINVWPVILLLADELGFSEVTVHSFFGEKPNYNIADLIFSMYLNRLYGSLPAKEFLAIEKTVNLGEVHTILKTQEALIQGIDLQKGSEEKQSSSSENSELEYNQLQECIKQFLSIMQQHEETRKKYEETVDRLTDATKKALATANSQNSIGKADTDTISALQKADFGNGLWKRTIKLEKENAVLQVQLESLQRESELKHQSLELVKDMQIRQLKEQMDMYLCDLEKIRFEKQNMEQKFFTLQQDEMKRSFRRKRHIEEKQEPGFDERQKLVLKILGSKEYPDYLKKFIKEAYHDGICLEQMKAFDVPGLDKHNFEMMKGVLQ